MMGGPIQLSLGIRLHLELRQDMIPSPGLYPAVEAGRARALRCDP